MSSAIVWCAAILRARFSPRPIQEASDTATSKSLPLRRPLCACKLAPRPLCGSRRVRGSRVGGVIRYQPISVSAAARRRFIVLLLFPKSSHFFKKVSNVLFGGAV